MCKLNHGLFDTRPSKEDIVPWMCLGQAKSLDELPWPCAQDRQQAGGRQMIATRHATTYTRFCTEALGQLQPTLARNASINEESVLPVPYHPLDRVPSLIVRRTFSATTSTLRIQLPLPASFHSNQLTEKQRHKDTKAKRQKGSSDRAGSKA